MNPPNGKRVFCGVAIALLLMGCSASSSERRPTHAPGTANSGGGGTPSPGPTAKSTPPPESPVPAESNPPGDIPDSTRFLPFRSASGHLALNVPEGWSRRTTRSSVSLTDKLNSITVEWFKASAAPTVGTARAEDIPLLQRTTRAFSLKDIRDCAPSCTIPYTTNPIDVHLTAGPAVVIRYFANSAPNSVTGRQYRDEVLRFEFFKGGTEAALTLSGPVGSDNVDPWRLVSESFAWR